MAKKHNKVPDLNARPRRKKKAAEVTTVEAAEPPAQEVIDQPAEPLVETLAEPQAAPPSDPAPRQETAPEQHTEQVTRAERQLPVARPRKSGRIALDINLGGEGHTWERVK